MDKSLTFNDIFKSSFLEKASSFSILDTFIPLTLALAIGMVGALSIVRFRSAIKEPMDILYIFWSISVAIVLGAGLIPLAVIGSLFIGLFMIIFVNRKT